jgi:hypothetical protein
MRKASPPASPHHKPIKSDHLAIEISPNQGQEQSQLLIQQREHVNDRLLLSLPLLLLLFLGIYFIAGLQS